MLYTQLKRPVTLATLLFLLLAGVAVRWNEYTLPRYARRVDATAGALAEVPPRTSSTESENAAPLYEEAHQLLQTYWQEEPDYIIWQLVDKWLNIGTFPLPDDLRHSLEAHLENRRDALVLLYRAATIPTVAWTVHSTREVPHRDTWPWSFSIRYALLLDTLLQMDDHNKDGVLRAISALNAFGRAKEQIDPPIAQGRDALLERTWGTILNAGFVTGVLSDATMDVLDDILSFEEDLGRRAMRRYWLESRFEAALYGPHYPTYWNRFGYNGFSSPWYEVRFSARNGMKELLLYELLLKSLPGLLPGAENTELVNTLQQVTKSKFFIPTYGLTFDPYTSDRYFSGINCSIRDFLNIFDSEYSSLQMRLPLRTVIALEQYRRRNGEFPENLEALSPTYLSPDLLRMVRETIAYHRTPAGWELSRTSTGLDRRDSLVLYRYPL